MIPPTLQFAIVGLIGLVLFLAIAATIKINFFDQEDKT